MYTSLYECDDLRNLYRSNDQRVDNWGDGTLIQASLYCCRQPIFESYQLTRVHSPKLNMWRCIRKQRTIYDRCSFRYLLISTENDSGGRFWTF